MTWGLIVVAMINGQLAIASWKFTRQDVCLSVAKELLVKHKEVMSVRCDNLSIGQI